MGFHGNCLSPVSQVTADSHCLMVSYSAVDMHTHLFLFSDGRKWDLEEFMVRTLLCSSDSIAAREV